LCAVQAARFARGRFVRIVRGVNRARVRGILSGFRECGGFRRGRVRARFAGRGGGLRFVRGFQGLPVFARFCGVCMGAARGYGLKTV